MEEEALRAESRVPSHLDERHEQRVVLVYIYFSGGTKDQTGLTSFKFDIFSLYLIVESVHDIYTCVINSSRF